VGQTLEQALAAAYQTNPGLQAERAKLRVADELVSQAMSGFRPIIDATAESGRSHQSVGPHIAGDLSPSRMGFNVTQPVFSGFRTMSDVQSAKAKVKAQRADLSKAEQQLLLESARAYLSVVQALAVLGIDRDREAFLKKELFETKDRLKIGELKKTDVE
jgi:outer membrane protein TolC